MTLSRSSARTEAANSPLRMYGSREAKGGIDLANAVLNTLENKKSNFKVLYDDEPVNKG